ncbi:helix-hairpin-helix domain-containing protein [Natrialbaceae archaeon A-CW1-1]
MRDELLDPSMSGGDYIREQWWRHQVESNEESFCRERSLEESIEDFWTSHASFDESQFEAAKIDVDDLPIEHYKEPPESLTPAFDLILEWLCLLTDDQDGDVSNSTEIEKAIDRVPSVGPTIASKLSGYGFETVGDIREATRRELTDVNHVGPETADKLKGRLGDICESPCCEEVSDTESRHIEDSYPVDQLHEEIQGLGQASCGKLYSAGYETVGDLRAATTEDLTEVIQIGPDTASKIAEGIAVKPKDRTSESPVCNRTTVDELVEIIPGLSHVLCAKLKDAGFVTVGDLRSAPRDDIMEADHIGKDRAKRIKEYVS